MIFRRSIGLQAHDQQNLFPKEEGLQRYNHRMACYNQSMDEKEKDDWDEKQQKDQRRP